MVDQVVNRFTVKALFATLTNVDFDPIRLADMIRETVKKREALKQAVAAARGSPPGRRSPRRGSTQPPPWKD